MICTQCSHVDSSCKLRPHLGSMYIWCCWDMYGSEEGIKITKSCLLACFAVPPYIFRALIKCHHSHRSVQAAALWIVLNMIDVDASPEIGYPCLLVINSCNSLLFYNWYKSLAGIACTHCSRLFGSGFTTCAGARDCTFISYCTATTYRCGYIRTENPSRTVSSPRFDKQACMIYGRCTRLSCVHGSVVASSAAAETFGACSCWHIYSSSIPLVTHAYLP
jgi:hypothetical protein